MNALSQVFITIFLDMLTRFLNPIAANLNQGIEDLSLRQRFKERLLPNLEKETIYRGFKKLFLKNMESLIWIVLIQISNYDYAKNAHFFFFLCFQ